MADEVSDSTAPDNHDSLWSYFVDAHCHPTDSPDTLDRLETSLTRQFFAMGTRPEDWPEVDKIAKQWPQKVIPAFGKSKE